MLDFKNKIILITGASSGLGEQLALLLGKKKARLILVARRRNRLQNVAEKIKKNRGRAWVFSCDVSDYDQVISCYKKINREVGEVDFAFLNAGIGSNQLVQNLNVGEVRRVMDINFFGVIHWLEPLLKSMQPKNEGTIVITSSLAAYRGLPGSSSYSASKSALNAFVESAQIDLLATKIKIILVMPYFMITEMSGLGKERNMKIWIKARQAAQIIIKGVEEGKQEIIFPWQAHLLMYLFKTFPLTFYRFFWRILRRGG